MVSVKCYLSLHPWSSPAWTWFISDLREWRNYCHCTGPLTVCISHFLFRSSLFELHATLPDLRRSDHNFSSSSVFCLSRPHRWPVLIPSNVQQIEIISWVMVTRLYLLFSSSTCFRAEWNFAQFALPLPLLSASSCQRSSATLSYPLPQLPSSSRSVFLVECCSHSFAICQRGPAESRIGKRGEWNFCISCFRLASDMPFFGKHWVACSQVAVMLLKCCDGKHKKKKSRYFICCCCNVTVFFRTNWMNWTPTMRKLGKRLSKLLLLPTSVFI